MEIYRSNLLTALNIAMKKERKEEAKIGYTSDSGFVAGLQEIFNAIKNGENEIILKD